MDNFTAAMGIMDTIAIVSFLASLTSIFLMVKFQVYRHSLMSIIFYMTIVQAVYDISMISKICGICPTAPLHDPVLIEWAQCKAIQYGIVRFCGLSAGLFTNLISVLVAYVILFRRRIPMPTWLIVLLVFGPSALIGVYFGVSFYEQTVTYGLIGKVGGSLTRFNVIVYVYNATNVASLALNILSVGYISWELKSTGIICSKTSSSSSSAATAGDANMADSLASSTGSVDGVASPARQRTVFPMFVLAKRLMLYPVVQIFVIFGTAYYGIDQNGEAIEAYPPNVIHNPEYGDQTTELFIFALLMPLAGMGYFGVFLFVQKGAKTYLASILKQPFLCLFGTSSSSDDTTKGPGGDNRMTRTSSDSASEADNRSSISDSPFHSKHALDNDIVRNDPKWAVERESFSYSVDGASALTSPSISTDSNANPYAANAYDFSYRGSISSDVYFEERATTFRQKAAATGVSVAKQLSTINDLKEEDVDGLHDDDLIQLIELSSRDTPGSKGNSLASKDSSAKKKREKV